MFPSELSSVRAVCDPPLDAGIPLYVVGAMMTPSYARFGRRLADSCAAQSLPLALFEVPSVHRSISPHGSDDLRFTKANFVNFLLERYQRPVLYVDVDCVFAQFPMRIHELLTAQVDFAIFNWLAEEHTEAYKPAAIAVRDHRRVEQITHDRFYRFSHSIDLMSKTQLLCSGAVQLYNSSDAARSLLASWQRVIERSPGSADDKCLDFAFNNYSNSAGTLRAAWLEKSYARYAWWIYERPVIDHPELPHSGYGFVALDELDGKHRIYTDSVQQPSVNYVFPEDCLIDTQSRVLLRSDGGTWRPAGAVSIPLWL